MKIGAYVNFGNIGQSKFPDNVPGWYTYFDTNDPNFGSQGSGILGFAVKVDTNVSSESITGSPRYCSVFAKHEQR